MHDSIQIVPPKKLIGEISIPPDKSISHRAAIFAALHSGTSVIQNYSPAQDPQDTLQCLSQLGVSITKDQDQVCIHSKGRHHLKPPQTPLDCGNSGTTMRLLSGVLVGAGIKAILTGDSSLNQRPMTHIINPLRQMGATIKTENKDLPPLHIQPTTPCTAIHYDMPVASAQVKSCLLLAGCYTAQPTMIGETITTRNHTEEMLGLTPQVKNHHTWYQTSINTPIPNQTQTIPGDISSAAFWLVAATLIPNSHLVLKGVGLNPTRKAIVDILLNMGAHITITETNQSSPLNTLVDINVNYSPLHAIDLDYATLMTAIDEIPILSVALAFAHGTTTLPKIPALRIKECDRITAIQTMYDNAHVPYHHDKNNIYVQGNPNFIPKTATYHTYNDHRMAMSMTIMALKAHHNSLVQPASAINTSYPQFWDTLTILAQP